MFRSQDTQVFVFLKETRNSFKKLPLNLWWISNKTIMEVGKYYKSCYIEKFSSPKLLKHAIITFFETVLFNIFMRKTLMIFGGYKKYELRVSFNDPMKYQIFDVMMSTST